MRALLHVLAGALLAQPPTAPQPLHPARAEVAGFDCADARAGGGGPITEGGLSTWTGGGPLGAAWNAQRLRCVAEVRTGCEAGRLALELRVGTRLVQRRALAFGPGAPLAGVQEFRLEARDWVPGLDPRQPRHPVRTGVFRAVASLRSCTRPKEGVGVPALSERNFVAGFAWGE